MSRLIFDADTLGGTTTLSSADAVGNFTITVPAVNGTLSVKDASDDATFRNITLTGAVLAGAWNGSTITVPYGGTGATTLTGYVKGNGTSAMTASATIPNTDITGLGTMSTQNANAVAITGGTISGLSAAIPVASGGTGATTLTGYVKGNGTSLMTASATIPNTDITGLGTMSTQGSDAVTITGGTANGLTIGGTTAAAGTFTTLRFNSTLSANGNTGTSGQVLTSNGASAPTWQSVAGVGTVTSVDGSGGTTGLTLTGGPITSSGTLTLGGTLAVANGGTGAVTLTGYVKGNGTGVMTASATIPNTDITGLGTMSTQAASAVDITGGTIVGTSITVADNVFTLQDDADPTKQAQFQLVNIPTGTTTTYTLPAGVANAATLIDAQTVQSITGAKTFAGIQTFSGVSGNFCTGANGGTVNVSSGATVSGQTKIVNLGTGGQSGSTTAITVGSANGSTTTMLGSTNISAGSFNGTVGATTANTGAFTTLSTSGVATFSAGAVGTPAITTTGDTNTGIFFPAADTIAASTAGVERLRIDSSGNVGINTSSPTTFGGSLVVYAASNPISVIASGSANAYLRLYSTSDNNMYLANLGGSMAMLTANTERMRIDSVGNVGIGTSSPNASALLDVQSTTKGVRMPNMTTTQKNAIASPAAGLMVFDTTLSKLSVYSGAAWQTITSV